jgi:hypothetical protein
MAMADYRIGPIIFTAATSLVGLLVGVDGAIGLTRHLTPGEDPMGIMGFR